jgi:transposase
MGKAKTPSFILELGLEVNAHEEAELNKRFEAARQLYNACLSEAKRRLFLLRQSKEYKEALRLPKTINVCALCSYPAFTVKAVDEHKAQSKPNFKRTEAFKALNTKFGFSEYFLHTYAAQIRQSWIGNHIDSATAQKLATRAFKAVQRLAFGQAKKVRFKGKNQLKSVEGKSNKTGIRYKETGHIEWSGLKLKCQIDVNDEVVVHGLSCPVKYCRIIKHIFNRKTRFFVQLILEGKPLQKLNAKDKTVGLDIGPSTIAYVSDKYASLERFCDELKDKQKEIRRLQRKLERQRRVNNPQNYNTDGTIFLFFRQPFRKLCRKNKTIKKGKKTWNDSKRYLRTKTKLAELQRKLTAHRKTLHGNLANRIMIIGKHIKTEKLSYRTFQKNYGKSVKDRAPGMFVEILRRKAENAGGRVDEFPTKTTKLSQYCHKCGKYTKKPLSQRVHTCCNLNIQRDLYSAFLAMSVVENTDEPTSRFVLDTADVIKRWRSTEAVLQQAVSVPPFLKGVGGFQVANGRHCLPALAVRPETERFACEVLTSSKTD